MSGPTPKAPGRRLMRVNAELFTNVLLQLHVAPCYHKLTGLPHDVKCIGIRSNQAEFLLILESKHWSREKDEEEISPTVIQDGHLPAGLNQLGDALAKKL